MSKSISANFLFLTEGEMYGEMLGQMPPDTYHFTGVQIHFSQFPSNNNSHIR